MATGLDRQQNGRGNLRTIDRESGTQFRYERTDGDRARTGGANGGADRLARGLGWFGIGLGVAELLAPAEIARLIGIDGDDAGNQAIVRAVGLREIAAGLGILSRAQPTEWLWARVGGDAMDLALLRAAHEQHGADRERVTAAMAAVLGVGALDLLCAIQSGGPAGAENGGQGRGIPVERYVTINRSPAEVYRFWHDFENLPRFMLHLESVRVTGDRRSHWTAKGPAGRAVEWDAEIVEDQPNRLIAWRSLPGADVDNEGEVRFDPAPGNRGTEVRVKIDYSPPAGVVGATIAKLFGEEPSFQIREDLRRFKQIVETGEVVVSDATLEGARLRQHPAQPPEHVPAGIAGR